MCGIIGFQSPDFQKDHLQQAAQLLRHRGPDAEGLFFDEASGTGLAHTRLSILDLSESANQPFFSADQRWVIVFNGEVYSYREVAKWLKNKGLDINWRTSGDTEVLVEAFSKVGEAILPHLNGMFALALLDRATQSLFLLRDRLGIKPLYLYQQGPHLAFASEINALVALLNRQGISLALHCPAVRHFLHYGYIPDGMTIWEGITPFPAGHFGRFEQGKLTITPFWKAEEKIATKPLSPSLPLKNQLREKLEMAVSRRLISDVPLGTFLSGGTDSSVVTALARKLHGGPIKTFSIGFKEAKFDESRYAAQVANHLGTEHHAFQLSYQDALERVSLLPDCYGQPYADSSAIPTLLVSEMARKHVTVALSGDGGDELFLGYGMYQWAKRLQNPLVNIASPLIETLLKQSKNERFVRASTLFDVPKNKRIASHIFSQEQYLFSEAELQSLLLPPFRGEMTLAENWPIARQLSAPEQQAFFDLKHYLKEDLLVKVDIASMQHALEVRVPLLDFEVVEFALNLPLSAKINGGNSKYLLKQVLYDLVPAAYFDRPKWGFSIPLNDWLGRELRYLLDEYLSPEWIQEAGFVSPEIVGQLKSRYLKGEKWLYNRLWVLLMLHKWWRNQA